MWDPKPHKYQLPWPVRCCQWNRVCNKSRASPCFSPMTFLHQVKLLSWQFADSANLRFKICFKADQPVNPINPDLADRQNLRHFEFWVMQDENFWFGSIDFTNLKNRTDLNLNSLNLFTFSLSILFSFIFSLFLSLCSFHSFLSLLFIQSPLSFLVLSLLSFSCFLFFPCHHFLLFFSFSIKSFSF